MIELGHIHAGYEGRPVLEDVTLRADSGVTCIIGPNGCGKSTLLKVAARLKKPEAGSLRLNGRPYSDFSPREFARQLSFLPQIRDTAAATVYQMVMHGRFPYLGFPRRPGKGDRQIAWQAMVDTGVEAMADKPLAALSGGERQKVYLAMMLAQDTPVVLLDEPATYLDIRHQLEILNLMGNMRQRGKTVLAVMHDLNQALEIADRVCLMDAGRIVALDAPKAVIKSGEIDRVFGVRTRRMADEAGREYYRFVKE